MTPRAPKPTRFGRGGGQRDQEHWAWSFALNFPAAKGKREKRRNPAAPQLSCLSQSPRQSCYMSLLAPDSSPVSPPSSVSLAGPSSPLCPLDPTGPPNHVPHLSAWLTGLLGNSPLPLPAPRPPRQARWPRHHPGWNTPVAAAPPALLHPWPVTSTCYGIPCTINTCPNLVSLAPTATLLPHLLGPRPLSPLAPQQPPEPPALLHSHPAQATSPEAAAASSPLLKSRAARSPLPQAGAHRPRARSRPPHPEEDPALGGTLRRWPPGLSLPPACEQEAPFPGSTGLGS